MAGEANSMVSVYSTLCRWTATSNFTNAVNRQRNLGLYIWIPQQFVYASHQDAFIFVLSYHFYHCYFLQQNFRVLVVELVAGTNYSNNFHTKNVNKTTVLVFCPLNQWHTTRIILAGLIRLLPRSARRFLQPLYQWKQPTKYKTRHITWCSNNHLCSAILDNLVFDF